MRARRVRACWTIVVACVGFATPAASHPLAPSLLELREGESGRVDVTWKTTLLQPAGSDLRPELPSDCAEIGGPDVQRAAGSVRVHWTVDCGEQGLVGHSLRVLGLETTRTDALVRVELADGRRPQAVLSGAGASFRVPARQRALDVAVGYARLGVGHILTGFDHLLFVLGLLILVAGRRALLATVTAFTLGHSVTLSLAALGFVDIPPRPVEFAIAVSILVLAVELAREDTTGLLHRRPSLLVFSFGLLHGLGFAGALAAVGLPPEEIPVALLCFNVGIELGQLAFIAAVLLVALAFRARIQHGPAWLRAAPTYAIGSLAAFWCIERAVAMAGPG